jgi:hypothetical protein
MEVIKCKDCIWFSKQLFVCFHPEKEGIRAFEETPACIDFISKCKKEDDECKNCFMLKDGVCIKTNILYQGMNKTLNLEENDN